MLELYHNALSTCSQKVRLVLAEKGLDFESHPVDLVSGEQHAPDYVKMNPNHVVPTLLHDGRVLIESSLINEYLDEAFPEPPLRPAAAAARHALRLWVKRIDEQVHPSAGIITYAIGVRRLMRKQPREAREAHIAAIPEAARRAARKSVIEHGVKAPEFPGAIGRFVEMLDAMESELQPGAWLSGDGFGLADTAVLPYVLRLDSLAMTPLLSEDARPRVADWYARVRARPSYDSAVTQWLPEAALTLFRTGGEEVWPDVEALIRNTA